MDIRTSVDGLKTLLGVPATQAQSQQAKSEASSAAGSLAGDQATLSSAGSQVSQAANESDVRMNKVTAVQADIAAGTYNVPESAVASKIVDTMLANGRASTK